MKYTIVTSLNQAYWDKGSDFNIMSWDKNFPKEVEIHIFSETPIKGVPANLSKRVIWHNNLYTEVPELKEFIEKHKDDPHYNGYEGKPYPDKQRYKFNAVKFAHKTFPLFYSKKYTSDWLIWLDADVMCYKETPIEFFNSVCNNDLSVIYLGRPDRHSECGFVAYNFNKNGKEFLEHFESYYYESRLSSLEQTHDSFVFDIAMKTFHDKRAFLNINKNAINNKHPFHSSRLREHLVHNKGHNKERKQLKFKKRYNL